ncbi:uncharacterized protein VTP21DRAFT_3023 [Calcarisporiella thermophila]|uniref:uncharacterized protein n=1 Tax=Calcarisporiella thermophila TaxID=911321 RepID=UPI003741FF9F
MSTKQKAKHPRSNQNSNDPIGNSAVKKRIRDLTRLLRKENLRADVRVEKERELKALKLRLDDLSLKEKERKLATRYHRVKFFERRKVDRKINQLQRKLASVASEDERKDLEAQIFEQKVNLNYIMHYPKLEKYVSLFPKENVDDPKTTEKREAIRNQIRDAMQRGEIGDGLDKLFRTKKGKKDAKKKTNESSTIEEENAGDDFFMMEEDENRSESGSDDSDGEASEESQEDDE